MLNRNQIPKTKSPRDIHFPEFNKIFLENGIKVYLVNDKRYPVTTIRLMIKAGSYYDFFTKGYKSGISTLTGEMLSKGTSSLNALEIAERIDFAGALFASGFGYDGSFLSITSLKNNFDVMLSLISDMLLNTVYSEEELESKKEQIINSIISLEDDGSYLAERVFKNIHYENTPYQYDPDGYVESLKKITIEDIKEFSSRYYNTENTVLAIVGDYDEKRIKDELEEKFNMPRSETITDIFEFNNKENGKGNVYLIEKEDASQTSLYMGHSGIKRNNKDFINVSFLNTILGGSFTSRINNNLRERNGLTYGARTSFNSRIHSGDFTIETEINSDKTGFAVEEIIKELNEIRENFVSDYELENAKNYITGTYPFQLETSNAVSGKLMTLELYGLEKDYYATYLSIINNISREDVRETARKYIHPENLKYTAAGNLEKMEEQLKKTGEIKITDKVI